MTETQERNKGAESLHGALWQIQKIPDVEIEFKIPWEQELLVRRQNLWYKVRQIGRVGRPYRYAVQAKGFGLPRYENSFKTYSEAVNNVYKMILHDPRQSDIPNDLHRTHYQFVVPVQPE